MLRLFSSTLRGGHGVGRRFLSSPRSKMPLTKVVATIGPASEEMEALKKCVNAGMCVMRLNFSHATAEEFFLRTGNLEKITEGDHVGIMLDTRGPEIRTGGLNVCKESGNRKAKVKLVRGSKIVLTTDPSLDGAGDETRMYVNYGELPLRVKAGTVILMDDGLVKLTVEKVEGTLISCVVENTNEMGERKGVNVPGVALGLPAMSEKDKKDIKFGIENGIDMIAASFISNAAGVDEMRAYIETCVAKHPDLYPGEETVMIISKIESTEALKNLDEIIEASDGIMVARGDLGVEVPIVSIATWQKTIVEKTISAGKPVIVATQMLDSMQKNPRPTRAEVADVSNAVLEGSDCVMLSGESANGDYPDLSISTQRDIALNAEQWERENHLEQGDQLEEMTAAEALGFAASAAQQAARAAAIVVVDCEDGLVTRTVARTRPSCPIFALVDSKRAARQLSIHRAVYAYAVETLPDSGEAAASCRAHGFATDDDPIVVICDDHLSIL